MLAIDLSECSEKFIDVLWHLINLSGVVLLDVSQDTHIIIGHEVDGNSLPVESTRATDSVNVKFS